MSVSDLIDRSIADIRAHEDERVEEAYRIESVQRIGAAFERKAGASFRHFGSYCRDMLMLGKLDPEHLNSELERLSREVYEFAGEAVEDASYIGG